METNLINYKTDVHNDWCPGCGDFGILNSIQMALSELKLLPSKTVIFSGIGCSGQTTHFINTYGIHTIHGRVLPFAQGTKLSNPKLTVIAVGGDGDGLGIGAGHFISAGRRNIDITYMMFNNGVYGLTKGQASPTLPLGKKTKTDLVPNIDSEINPISLAIVSGFTFVARGYAFNIKHLKNLIISAISHKGLSFLDIIQPCPTYNIADTEHNKCTNKSFYMLDSNYVPFSDGKSNTAQLAKILAKSYESDKIPLGIFYNDTKTPVYDKRLPNTKNYNNNPPALQQISKDNIPLMNISKILDSLQTNTKVI